MPFVYYISSVNHLIIVNCTLYIILEFSYFNFLIQDSLQTGLSHETRAHLECNTQLSEHKEKLVAAETERDKVKHKLTETQATLEQETRRNASLQVSYMQSNVISCTVISSKIPSVSIVPSEAAVVSSSTQHETERGEITGRLGITKVGHVIRGEAILLYA